MSAPESRWQLAQRPRKLFAIASIALCVTACAESTVPVEISGYNHMADQSIRGFSVDGASGPNISPDAGGGKFNCCISIPTHWKPGMKVRVEWSYGSGPDGSRPPPPPQEAIVEIPEYTPENLGTLQAHFYPNHRVLVVISKWRLGNARYPLPEKDWAPWTLNENWERNLKILEERKRRGEL